MQARRECARRARVTGRLASHRRNASATRSSFSEAVLHQEIGGKEAMRQQLLRLLSHERDPSVNVQVLPFETGVHAGLMGFFDIFRFASDPTIVHGEDYETGHPTADPDAVESRSLRYDHLQAAALSVKDSATLIRRVMEERYGGNSHLTGIT